MDYKIWRTKLKEINKFLQAENIHIFYICISSEKGNGIENLIKNFHIICLKDDDFWKHLTVEKNHYCVELNNPGIIIKNSYEIIKLNEVVDWIKSYNAKRTCVMTFKNTPRFEIITKEHDWELLNNISKISNFFENKFNLPDIATQANVKIPASRIEKLANIQESELPCVAQLPFGHTGNGTFIINSLTDLKKLIDVYNQTKFKISQYVTGLPMNINGIVINIGATLTTGLNIQLTGIPELSLSNSVTCGNNYEFENNINEPVRIRIINTCKKIGKFLASNGYRGLFGIDIIIEENTNEIFLIEINARQTANVSFYNIIQNTNCQLNSLLIHILTSLNFNLLISNDYSLTNSMSTNASQIICRNYYNKNFIIKDEIDSKKLSVNNGNVYLSSSNHEIGIEEEVFRIQYINETISINNELNEVTLSTISNIKSALKLKY